MESLKNKIKPLALLASLVFMFLCAPNTFATPSTSLPSWTGSNNLNQSGAAWYYYTFEGNKDYGDDEVVYVPSGNENVERTAIPAKTCKSYGGFWVLLSNGYNDGKYTGEPYSAVRVSDIAVSSLGSDYKDYVYTATDNINYSDPKASSKSFGDLKLERTIGTMSEGLKEYSKLAYTSAVPDYAKTDVGALRYFCYGNAPAETVELVNFSTVSAGNGNSSSAPVVNGGSYLSNSLVVNVGDQIKISFHHYIAKSADRELNSTVGYKIGNSVIGNGAIIEESIAKEGSVGSDELNNSLKRMRVSSNNYYAYEIITDDIYVEAIDGQERTYCQTINSDGSPGSSACVTIKPIVSMADVVTDCNYKKDGLFMDNEFFGNTVATVGVSKNNSLKEENITTAFAKDDTVTVYAKPGDIAQFSYSLCFGAHGVRNLSATDGSFMSGDNIDETGNVKSGYEMENSFKITTNAVKSDDASQNYLFGRADAFLDDTVVVSNADARQKDLKKLQGTVAKTEVSCDVDESACASEHHDCEMEVSDDPMTETIPYFSMDEDYLKGDLMIYQGSIYEAKSKIYANESMYWVEDKDDDDGKEEGESSSSSSSSSSKGHWEFRYELWKWVATANGSKPQCAWVDSGAGGGSFYGTDGQLPFYEDRDFYDIQKDKNEVIFASPDSKKGATKFEVSSILGSTLTQTLSYNYLAFWPSKLCNGVDCVGCNFNNEGRCTFGISKAAFAKSVSEDALTEDGWSPSDEDNVSQGWFSSEEEFEAAQDYFRQGKDTTGSGTLFQEGWLSTANNYRDALNRYNQGYTTIPSDAYNIGYGAYFIRGEKKTIDKTAKVVVPYNFDTSLSVEMDGYLDGTIYPGDVVDIKAKIDILPRKNPLTSSVDESGNLIPYATATPPNTKVNLIELLIPETVDIENENGKEYTYSDGEKEHSATLKQILNGEGDPYNKNSICKQYSSYLGDDLGECRTTTVAGNAGSLNSLPYADELKRVGNADSNPAGEMGYFDTEKTVTYNVRDEEGNITRTDEAQINKLKRVAPDAEAGYKYCVAVGINHGDSHNVSGKDLEANQYLENGDPNPLYAANSYSVSSSMNGNTPSSWKVSKFSCRTIVKKPTYQVWNGGVYSSGNISGAVYYKTVNTKVNLNKTKEDPIYAEKEKFIAPESAYFGSWAEYFIVSKGNVMGIASASALGYTTPTKEWYTYVLDQYGQPILDAAGNPIMRKHVSYFADTGLNTSVQDYCALARLTISNTSCKDGKAGKYTQANSATDETFVKDFKQRIIDYYTKSEMGLNDPGQINGGYSGDLSGISFADQNGADYLRVNGSFEIASAIARNSGQKTLVIEVDGPLTISSNVCILDSSGFCRSGSDPDWQNDYSINTNNLSLIQRNSDEIDASGKGIQDIPQIILIAESIEISPEVTQIDAWLITNSRNDENYDGGYINTCKGFTNSKTGSDICWKTLKFNAPVITSGLFLNRTGGAWPGYSGDVGNQAYDVLNEKMRAAVNTYAEQVVGELVASGTVDINNMQAFNNLNSEQKESFKATVERYYASCTAISNTTLDSCVKKKIVKRLKTLYPITINPDDPEDPKRKAYENAANYYAAWNSYSGYDDNPIDPSKNYAKSPASRDLSCDGTITPAEIFDLNPVVYYWVLAESQKNNKAFITYAQEFAPRY